MIFETVAAPAIRTSFNYVIAIIPSLVQSPRIVHGDSIPEQELNPNGAVLVKRAFTVVNYVSELKQKVTHSRTAPARINFIIFSASAPWVKKMTPIAVPSVSTTELYASDIRHRPEPQFTSLASARRDGIN